MNIPDYPNYLIYEDGRVFTKKRNKFLTPNMSQPDGYKIIRFCKEGKMKSFKLHRLLATCYIPNPDNKRCVDHIDRNKLNNSLDNLRWATDSENQQNVEIGCTNTSGLKNIRYINDSNIWSFEKSIKGIKHKKSFNTKEEAIEYKKKYMELNKLSL